MMTGERFRALALAIPGAVEASHMGHPDFRLGGKIFATLSGDEVFGVVNLDLDAQERFVEKYPGQFEALAGGWGRRGWTRVVLKVARVGPVREAMGVAVAKVGGGGRAVGATEPV